ncbi:hypothetical protein ISCGN_021844 [Ixodes scapularis]
MAAMMADVLQVFLLSPLSTFSVMVWIAALVLHALSPRLEARGAKPRLVARESDFSRFLAASVPAFSHAYAPPPWASHPTVQSVLAATVLRRASDVPFFRILVGMTEPDVISIPRSSFNGRHRHNYRHQRLVT